MNSLKIFQTGWNYSQDGPGNRLVYHLQGCNIRCPWCSNPEGLSKTGTFLVHEDKLIDQVCPHGGIKDQKLNRDLCHICHTRECITKNKNLGIQFSCRDYTIEYLLTEVEKSRPLFYNGGGVTLTGGEPTVQFEEIKEFYKALKTEKVNTALETNGTHPQLAELFPLVDNLMIDFKHYDGNIHRQTTGIDNRSIIENIKKAAREHDHLLIRIPIIHGFNDTVDDAYCFAQFFKQLPNNKMAIELLPYQQLGEVKWRQCGLKYPLKTAVLSGERLQTFSMIFNREGLNLVHT